MAKRPKIQGTDKSELPNSEFNADRGKVSTPNGNRTDLTPGEEEDETFEYEHDDVPTPLDKIFR